MLSNKQAATTDRAISFQPRNSSQCHCSASIFLVTGFSLEVFVTVFWYNCFASTSTWSRLPVATSFSFICWPQSQICSTKVLNQAETSKQHMRTWHAFSNCSDKIRLSLLFQASMSSLVLRPWTWRRSLMCVKTNCMHELKCIQLKFMHAMSIQVTDGQTCHRHQQAFPASTRHSKKIKTQVQLENSCKTPIPPRLSNDVFNIRRCRLQWCLSCRWGSSRLTLDNQNKLKHAPIRKTKPINVQGTAASTWRSLRCPMWWRLLKKNIKYKQHSRMKKNNFSNISSGNFCTAVATTCRSWQGDTNYDTHYS